jgi:WhiB family redox-sensing transcriptional regulator
MHDFAPFGRSFLMRGLIVARLAMSHIYIYYDSRCTVGDTEVVLAATHPSRGSAMADFSRLPGPNADLWDWQLVAACRGVDSSLFFHPEGERGAARSAREAAAKEVCMRCPVRAECATHALSVREPYGVWGGLTEDEREEMMGRSRHRMPVESA